jgi:hypothetical protein
MAFLNRMNEYVFTYRMVETASVLPNEPTKYKSYFLSKSFLPDFFYDRVVYAYFNR